MINDSHNRRSSESISMSPFSHPLDIVIVHILVSGYLMFKKANSGGIGEINASVIPPGALTAVYISQAGPAAPACPAFQPSCPASRTCSAPVPPAAPAAHIPR